MTRKDLVLTDPTGSTRALGPLSGVAMKFVADERDLPFIRFMAISGLVMGTGALVLYWPGAFRWWLGVVYLAVTVGYFAPPYILMAHNVIHRPLFRPQYRWMRKLVPWVWGPFFGHTPESYYAHHVGMHHVENNMQDDASSTLDFQRDSFVDFLRYSGRFMVVGVWDVARYFWKKRQHRILRHMLVGEAVYYVGLAALFFVNWRATLIVFALPLIIVRFAMMTGNWGQHAFIDAADPANDYRSSITCINTLYNRRCFNDGYHIGHHVKMTRHWTEMPGDFQKNIDTYVREGAIVFEGLDYSMVWLFLMLKRYDWLARRYVDLADSGATQEQIMARLKVLTRRVVLPRATEASIAA